MTVVAIDGPAGAGKSTIAAAVARRLGIPHIDTGAFYRAATLAVLRAGADPSDAGACEAIVARARIIRERGRTRLAGEDVEDEIRGPDVTAAVSTVSSHPQVRALLLAAQRREIGPAGGVVEGRDAGTVVVPDADLKVWLTARPEVRAGRRAAQVGGASAAGEHHRQLSQRDAADAERMVPADDAIPVDTSDHGIDEVVESIVGLLGEAAPSASGRRSESP